MNNIIEKISRRLDTYEICILPNYAQTVEWLEVSLRHLKKFEINVDIRQMLEFNPWYIMEREKKHIRRFRKAIEDIEARRKKKPSLAILIMDKSIDEHIEALRCYQLSIEYCKNEIEDRYGIEAEWAFDDADAELRLRHLRKAKREEEDV